MTHADRPDICRGQIVAMDAEEIVVNLGFICMLHGDAIGIGDGDAFGEHCVHISRLQVQLQLQLVIRGEEFGPEQGGEGDKGGGCCCCCRTVGT